MSIDALVFVEDPGAANWIVALRPGLEKAGLRVQVVAAGAAKTYLRERGVSFETANDETSTAAANTLLDKYRPRLVMVGTSENLDTLGLRLITEARRRDMRSISFVDQAANAEHRFRGRTNNSLAHAPDVVLLPDEAARATFSACGFPPNSLVVTGNPHHDRVVDAARALAREGRAAVRARVCPALPSNRPLVVFLSEIGYVVNPEGPEWERQFTLAGRGPDFPRGKATFRTAIVLEEVIDALSEIAPRPLLVVRLHPKNARDEFAAYAGEVDGFSAEGDPLALVFAADLVIGMTTALLEEAYIMGRPALAILPRPEERDWLEAVRTGRIAAACERSAIAPAIKRLLSREDGHAKPDQESKTSIEAAVRCINSVMREYSGEQDARL